MHFNPQGSREPRRMEERGGYMSSPNFNPQGPRGPRLIELAGILPAEGISIHKALAGLDGGGHHPWDVL